MTSWFPDPIMPRDNHPALVAGEVRRLQVGPAATDIEHIVALGEAHDSGIADDRRRDIAADLDNLTIADPQVNRTQKSDAVELDAGPVHGAWFAECRQARIRVVSRREGTGCAEGVARRRRGAAELRERGHHVADGWRSSPRSRAL